jgi:DNA-binding beta-propeller fold protein YncE
MIVNIGTTTGFTQLQCIRKVVGGLISKFAGTCGPLNYGFSGDGGLAVNAKFYYCLGVTYSNDALLISDYYNHIIRKVKLSTGIISTIAGTPQAFGYTGNFGQATSAKLYHPFYITLDMAGNVYVCDQYNGAVRVISRAGIITTIAGNGALGFSGDGGAATSAQMSSPLRAVFDGAGNMYIADYSNARIRVVTNR